ncbi:MAG: hypothetical protein WDN04_14310 [Rhodospirillales bacterium]
MDIDRKLVKGNLRTKGGRGLHAAQMTSLDAARLLTAILASPLASASAEVVERYARTRVDKTRSSDKFYAAAQLDDLSSLPVGHSFVDGLASLITSASKGTLAQLRAKAGEDWVPQIEIFAFTRVTRGRIRVAGLPSRLTASVEYMPSKGGHPSPPAATGDLEQSRRITERTILAVAQLLSLEDRHERS